MLIAKTTQAHAKQMRPRGKSCVVHFVLTERNEDAAVFTPLLKHLNKGVPF
jgi:hypothetical protein